ncbi:MAG TPA: hypothetical protein VMJ75_25505 [Candidatus Acidoferrales bacterium]|nr:hypothetical protein [Candidatus Acidoferrales bacterium]
MSEWVDLQLAHQLTAVKAPDELWERVQGRSRRRQGVPGLALATAAAVLAVVAMAYSSTRPREIPKFGSLPPGSCLQCHL